MISKWKPVKLRSEIPTIPDGHHYYVCLNAYVDGLGDTFYYQWVNNWDNIPQGIIIEGYWKRALLIGQEPELPLYKDL